MVQDTNTKASATTLGRIPVVDPEPNTPCSLTFKAQNTVSNVAETAVVDDGSHDIDIPIKGHLQEGSAEEGQTQIVERSWKPGEQQMVEQGAEQRVLQPQEDGQKSLKQGQLKAAERQKGTEGTGRRSNSEWAGGLGSNRRVNGVTGHRGVRRWERGRRRCRRVV